jgi:AraC family transcriptional regulator, regulatory protein of adaptative response / methylphosphotriester-DNA alkyltransferase methyltransferase
MARRRKTEESLRDLFRDALELMAENPAANASLTGLARRLATSPRQLERAFAEAGSTTFRAELTSARVRRAERFLRNPALTVAEVAKAVGYEQPPHSGEGLPGSPRSAARGAGTRTALAGRANTTGSHVSTLGVSARRRTA